MKRRPETRPTAARADRSLPTGPSQGAAPAPRAPRGRPYGDSGGPPPRESQSESAPQTRAAPGQEVVYGLRAALAVLAVRPEDVLQIACSGRSAADASSELRAAEERGIPCAELSDRELEGNAGSPHHEGLVVTTRPRSWATPRQLAEVLVAARGVALALDRVRNPYNIGAILRTAAFFGVDAVILGALAPGPDLASNAVRVAEGGAERVILCRTPDLGETLARMKSRGISIVGADAHSTQNAIGHRFKRPTILVLGHEREGMTSRVRAQCDELIRVPGSGTVESLNVSVAAGVLISELVRQA